MKFKKKYFLFFICLVFILIDFLTKTLIFKYIGENNKITLITNFLYISPVLNTGMIFGILNNNNFYTRIILTILALIALTYSTISYFHIIKTGNKITLFNFLVSVLYAGLIGNAIDHFFYWKNLVGFDGVIDWIKISFFDYIFNLADAYIIVSCVLIVILYFFNKNFKHEFQLFE